MASSEGKKHSPSWGSALPGIPQLGACIKSLPTSFISKTKKSSRLPPFWAVVAGGVDDFAEGAAFGGGEVSAVG